MPKTKAIDKRLGPLVDEFKELVYPPDYNPEEKVSKRKQGEELGYLFIFLSLFLRPKGEREGASRAEAERGRMRI